MEDKKDTNDSEIQSPASRRHELGEAFMICADCGARLYSFNGSEDAGRPCPHPQKCQDERI